MVRQVAVEEGKITEAPKSITMNIATTLAAHTSDPLMYTMTTMFMAIEAGEAGKEVECLYDEPKCYNSPPCHCSGKEDTSVKRKECVRAESHSRGSEKRWQRRLRM